MIDPIYLGFRESNMLAEAKKEEEAAIQVLTDLAARKKYFENGGSLLTIYEVYKKKMNERVFENWDSSAYDLDNCIELSRTNKSLWTKFLEWLGLSSDTIEDIQLDVKHTGFGFLKKGSKPPCGRLADA